MTRFRAAASLATLVLLVAGGAQRAAAEVFDYSGVFTLCTATCDSFAALGGPGGSNNAAPTEVTGTIEINVGANASFGDADIVTFDVIAFNPAAPTEAANFDGSGNLTNPNTANPLPLSPAVANLTGSGTTNATGNFSGGSLVFKFTVPPFSSNNAIFTFNIGTGSAVGALFDGVITFSTLTGTFALQVLPGDISVTPASADLGNVDQGGAAGSATVTVSNDGLGPLSINAINSANITAPLSVDGSACLAASPLAPSATCDISVALDSANTGAFTGSFAIESSDPDSATTTVAVSGNVVAPAIAFAPASLVFDQTIVGNFAERMIQVSNAGDGDLVIGVIGAVDSLVAPYQIVANGCDNMTLVPAATCALTLQFMPATEGMFMDSFDVPSNDPNSPATYMVQGESVDLAKPEITAAPTSLALGEVLLNASTSGTVTLTNTGTDLLTFTSIAVAGDADIAQANDCAATLAVQASCTVTVTLTGATGGAKASTLTVVSDANLSPTLDVAITGSVFDGPRATVTPATLQIGSMAAPVELEQTQSGDITVTNGGTSDLIVTSVMIGAGGSEFSVADDCTTAAVAAGASCTISVTFAPVTAGDKMTTVDIASNDAANPSIQVAVTGFVFMGARASAAPDPLVFGSASAQIEVGQSANGAITISSNGTDDLAIAAISVSGTNAASFTTTDDCTAAPLARGSTCTVNVTFTPVGAGTPSAVVDVSSNAAALAIALNGFSKFPPPPPPPAPPGSQTVTPPPFALGDTDSEGGCFIATAAFGSYLNPNVQVLRDFRDDVLLTNGFGQRLVAFYYDKSPLLASYISRNETARTVVRVLLTPLVYALAYPLISLALMISLLTLLRYRRRKLAV